jgi:Concanavalin A-like lectin/glucanases superfamily
MRKLLMVVLAALSFSMLAFAQETWDRKHETCDIVGPNGAVCNGLAGLYRFSEPADYIRLSETGGALLECPGTDVATTTTTLFNQARTASFDGTNSKGFIVSGGGSFGSGTWTMAVWVRPTANVTSTILSTQDASSGKEGVKLELNWNGTNLSPAISAYYQDADTQVTVGVSSLRTATSLNVWHLVVFRVGASTARKTWGATTFGYSLDNGTFQTATLTAPLRVNSGGNLVIGKSDAGADNLTGACSATGNGFTGYIQALAFYSRSLSPADVALLWNSGNGRDFPFLN